MKKFIATALITIILISCGKSDEQNNNQTTDTKVEKVKKETGPLLTLKYKLKKGDKFSYRLKTITKNTEEITVDTSIANNIVQTVTYKIDFSVKDVNESNTADIDVRINSILAETDFNGQSVKYDSKFIYSTREKVQFVDYEAVKKVPFNISVNEIGQVVKVDKVDRIMRNILEIQNVPDTLSAKTKEQMKFNIANGTLMPLTQQIFKVVSENEVGVDSTWQLKFNTPLAVFNVENTAIFKIDKFNFDEDTTASIKSTLAISVAGNNIAQEQGVTYTFSQPKLQASGNVLFNNSKGLVEKSESNTILEMAMLVEGMDANKKPIKSTKKDISNNTNIVELL
ncbi:MAG: hypothetical protein H6611_05220 [Ignavibacteriales bacterium]|nr:hypothetical protein [Ignavibacteriales bacterium]